ncbi:hypothetical protein NEOKW01_0918 [Nematocida sp. AWRm80]|nr:hypothetical protein NEOKW01_0918 [Nematocida sp. AWRm80]
MSLTEVLHKITTLPLTELQLFLIGVGGLLLSLVFALASYYGRVVENRNIKQMCNKLGLAKEDRSKIWKLPFMSIKEGALFGNQTIDADNLQEWKKLEFSITFKWVCNIIMVFSALLFILCIAFVIVCMPFTTQPQLV